MVGVVEDGVIGHRPTKDFSSVFFVIGRMRLIYAQSSVTVLDGSHIMTSALLIGQINFHGTKFSKTSLFVKSTKFYNCKIL